LSSFVSNTSCLTIVMESCFDHISLLASDNSPPRLHRIAAGNEGIFLIRSMLIPAPRDTDANREPPASLVSVLSCATLSATYWAGEVLAILFLRLVLGKLRYVAVLEWSNGVTLVVTLEVNRG